MTRRLAAFALVVALRWAAPLGAQQPTTEPPAQLEPVVVSASRVEQRLGEAPASVTVLGEEDLKASAAQTVDDLLRQIPGFSLFRRSSSLVTHPTTQGVSLRGIGPSGASRALVLQDGIPINDPFGGWVYWSKLPRLGIERIEVVRGGVSSLWGNYALGGVVNVVSRLPEPQRLLFEGSYGSHNTTNLDLLLSDVRGPFGVLLEGNFFETDGFKVVKESQRGAIDVEADSSHWTFTGKVEYRLSPDASLYVSGSYFTEDRGNGTPLQTNSTEAGQAAVGGRLRTPDGSDWWLTVFTQLQSFESTFSSQAADRNSETLALAQDVPTTGVGGSLQWVRRLGTHHLTMGVDVRDVDGETDEDVFAAGQFLRRRVAGGEQLLAGVFGQDIVALGSQWELVLGARVDYWRSFDGFRRDTPPPAGVPASQQFPDREEWAVSPRLALLYHPTPETVAKASAYQAFRTPTINELYRPFRVRTDVTTANPALDPERLTGGELGIEHRFGRAVSGRVTGFWNEVEDPIVNVTLPEDRRLPDCPSGTTCRQRQNLDRTRIRGVEAELAYRPVAGVELRSSYLYSNAEVVEASNQPGLEGKRLAQVPEHQVTLGVQYTNPALVNVGVQGRWVSDQFEDDENRLTLGDFFVVDVMIWRAITKQAELFLAVENLFDRTVEVAKTTDGVVTTGTPRLIRGGLRFRF
ncbi:MAG: TonB-dependent receptor [Candidatus Rokubacteria bacterium]|nr:TonB-dependent receptor [Candidatus Rokubacteria bacterium]